MSADRDVNRIVRSWLEEGRTALPDRVLDTVLDQLPATPQRRVLWPVRRFREMTAFTKFAVAAAAVVAAIAVIGAITFPRLTGTGAQPTPSPTASPVPTPTALLLPATGALDAGTYSYGESPARLTYTVPNGWSTTDGFVYKDRGSVSPAYAPGGGPGDVALVPWTVSHTYGDACHWQGNLVDAGSTVDELVSALQAQKSRVASTPTDVLLGGIPSRRLVMTTPADLDLASCDMGVVSFWPDPGPDVSGGLCCTKPGSTDVVYVVDVAGNRLVVVARHQADSLAVDLAELDGVIASLRFDVPAASPSPISPSASR
ncbi:MAG TPA: hypothetical protein VFY18_06760 [Candidatus Limnocylindrales bacterium]|nr:hypothetical protein [Candidatus Limnocylindrales bacterium]